jgi:hypothetical protein
MSCAAIRPQNSLRGNSLKAQGEFKFSNAHPDATSVFYLALMSEKIERFEVFPLSAHGCGGWI